MGEAVWGACVSHAAGQFRKPGEVELDKKDRVFAAWSTLRESLAAARPDAIVVFGTDHLMTFSYDLMPTFVLGRGERFESWGEFGSPRRSYNAVAELADELHTSLATSEFDIAGAVELRLDHAFSCPLELLDPESRIPVVPITINCFVPPLPSVARCTALGRALREAIESQSVVDRVAVIGTGALSHWVGVPETGRINQDFDELFLEWFALAALDDPGRFADDDILVEEGGRGFSEIRCWFAAAAAVSATAARTLVYEPVVDWITGIALVELDAS